MGTRYRVMVERIEDVEGAQYETRETVLFETVSPNLLSLLRYAPTEVDAALRTAFDDVEPWDLDRAAATVPAPSGVTATVFNANGEEIPAASAANEPPVEAPKRKRRSRAQIAADEAAEAAAATAEATARAGEALLRDVSAVTETGYMTPDGPVVEAIDPAPAEVPPPALPTVPYNPFAPK